MTEKIIIEGDKQTIMGGYNLGKKSIKEEEIKKEIELFKEITGHDYNNLGGGFSFGKQPVKVFIKEAKQQGIQEGKKLADRKLRKENKILKYNLHKLGQYAIKQKLQETKCQ